MWQAVRVRGGDSRRLFHMKSCGLFSWPKAYENSRFEGTRLRCYKLPQTEHAVYLKPHGPIARRHQRLRRHATATERFRAFCSSIVHDARSLAPCGVAHMLHPGCSGASHQSSLLHTCGVQVDTFPRKRWSGVASSAVRRGGQLAPSDDPEEVHKVQNEACNFRVSRRVARDDLQLRC